MLTPANRIITVAPGATAHVGKIKPVSAAPAWLAGRALNEWHPISGTLLENSGAGRAIQEFSSFALVGTRLIAAASGGHEVSDNRVVGIELNVDAPTWPASPLCTPSLPGDVVSDAAWNLDNKPNSRHTRFNIQYMPTINGGRVMLLGARDLYTTISPGSQPHVAGFNLATNTWDAPSTYPNAPAGPNGGGCVDDNGNGWMNGNQKLDAVTKTWSTITTVAAKNVRYPWANAKGKGYMFGLCYGDGWGYSLNLGICAVKQVGDVQTQITFNSSAALTQFVADVPAEAGMDYDTVNDYFLFCAGSPAGRVYKIIPNNTTVWDMEIFAYGSGNVMPIVAPGGTQKRFIYVPEFKGFVFAPGRYSEILFMKTASDTTPSSVPLWAQSAQIGIPLLIPNSSDFKGAEVDEYGGFGYRDDAGELFSIWNGGHAASSYDNSITRFKLLDNAPVWETRIPTSTGRNDNPYYADGSPAARHVYSTCHWLPQIGRFIELGGNGFHGAGADYGNANAYDPVTNTIDIASTWPSVPGNLTGYGVDQVRQHIWTRGGYRFDATTKTYSTPISNWGAVDMRYPMVHDPVRDVFFCLSWGSNISGSGSTLNSGKFNANGTGLQTAVTFNSSPGYTQFLADGYGHGSGMVFDSINNCFWWYNGQDAKVGNAYKITPNSGNAWDMELVTWNLPVTLPSGLCGCIVYSQKLKGVLIAPSPRTTGVYLIRTS